MLKHEICIFCGKGSGDFSPDKEICDVMRDLHHVAEHHTVIIPKRHASDFFDLHRPEIDAMYALVGEIKKRVETLDRKPSSPPQQEREDSNSRPLVLEFCGGRFALYQPAYLGVVP